ncbi:uncharacterized protein PITG_04558 [Phytophthora infestans T30-4]|uniref:Uncharacterized protein n=1 Tax=Phytophthora infestans (strain T30-4) TaxID=403677 RepID=D0N1I2_PHYIT|nr:uncharacterized protein PITG_04558 [Phytophthora infestans T30-4]EEY68161.1 hypothetical protein PITG_04558 [Phytophthora infestans T30-4]|eukprot:XP_002905320.1 hypothetical protein PITG_04558 [Phytophthora infestans T30-4]
MGAENAATTDSLEDGASNLAADEKQACGQPSSYNGHGLQPPSQSSGLSILHRRRSWSHLRAPSPFRRSSKLTSSAASPSPQSTPQPKTYGAILPLIRFFSAVVLCRRSSHQASSRVCPAVVFKVFVEYERIKWEYLDSCTQSENAALLPEQHGQALTSLTPGIPIIDLIDHPKDVVELHFTKTASSDDKNADTAPRIHSYVNHKVAMQLSFSVKKTKFYHKQQKTTSTSNDPDSNEPPAK